MAAPRLRRPAPRAVLKLAGRVLLLLFTASGVLGWALVILIEMNTGVGCSGSGSSHEAVASSLERWRQAVEWYRIQHEGRAPDARVVAQLTERTDVTGAPGDDFGPYLHHGIPWNQRSKNGAVRVVDVMPAEPLRDGGWVYCTSTGEVRVDVVGEDPLRTAFWSY